MNQEKIRELLTYIYGEAAGGELFPRVMDLVFDAWDADGDEWEAGDEDGDGGGGGPALREGAFEEADQGDQFTGRDAELLEQGPAAWERGLDPRKRGLKALDRGLRALEKARPGEEVFTLRRRDALLICYADMLSPAPGKGSGESALERLGRFLEGRNLHCFNWLHLLPFHPYSSDDGFSVIDYGEVDSRLGTWDAIAELGRDFNLVFDFVINHGSVRSEWFRRFLAGDPAFRDWYLTRDEGYDSSGVVRPRTHPLLTPFPRDDGGTVWVWTTFSADQADYDFSRPQVLLEFLRIFLEYRRRGGRMIRLDAIAYLWKEDGTPCLHHPKTHALVKLLRALGSETGPEMVILTETNVPHEENISYFGAGDEAHLVYNFALPPLVLHAAVSGDAVPLQNWAASLAPLPAGRYFLNFLASHDGVGLTPARGLIGEADFAKTLAEAEKRGARISLKNTPRGPVPYELNCSWADMTAPQCLGAADAQARAFLTTYAVALALPGLPAVYFHSWAGSRAWEAGPACLGYNRALNREKPGIDELEKELADPSSFRSRVMHGFGELFSFRAAEEDFDPDVPRMVLPSAPGLFVLRLGRLGGDGRGVLCAHNFSSEAQAFETAEIPMDLLVPPHGFRWIAFDASGPRRELRL
jgi:sucrose phosphorylase